MESSAKTGKNFFEGHRSTFCIKVPFGIGHPQPTHQMQSICVQEGVRVLNLQTEFNYLDSFKSYCNFSDLAFLSSGGEAGGWGVSGVIHYSLYEFRSVQR